MFLLVNRKADETDELWKAGGCLHGQEGEKINREETRIDGLHFFIFVNTRVDRTEVVHARDINTNVNLKGQGTIGYVVCFSVFRTCANSFKFLGVLLKRRSF